MFFFTFQLEDALRQWDPGTAGLGKSGPVILETFFLLFHSVLHEGLDLV